MSPHEYGSTCAAMGWPRARLLPPEVMGDVFGAPNAPGWVTPTRARDDIDARGNAEAAARIGGLAAFVLARRILAPRSAPDAATVAGCAAVIAVDGGAGGSASVGGFGAGRRRGIRARERRCGSAETLTHHPVLFDRPFEPAGIGTSESDEGAHLLRATSQPFESPDVRLWEMRGCNPSAIERRR